MNGKYSRDSASGLANARRLRLVVVIGIVLVLMWLLLDALEENLRRAEEQGAKLILNQIRSVLVVKGAEVRLSEASDYESQKGRNPFLWFETPPPGYAGLCSAALPPEGKWCFKPLHTDIAGYKKTAQGEQGQVIFRPHQPITLEHREGSREHALAWRVGIEFRDLNGNGRADKGEPQSGLTLEPTEVGQIATTNN